MNSNEKGGIISSMLMIPIGLALMLGFFFLGYYVGKYQNKSGAPGESMPALPEIVSKNLPKPEDFTFYKTLTAKDDKTVSLELKSKPVYEGKKADEGERLKEKTAAGPKKEKQPDKKAGPNKTSATVPPAAKQRTSEKQETAPAQNSKLRYTLQIASYPEKGDAESDIKKMKQQGYAAFIVASDLPGKGTWYRVRLGSFTNKASAEKLQKELREKAGVSPFITIE